MSVPDSPEFKKALSEAFERQYREYLFGGNHSKDSIGGTLEEIQRQREKIESKYAGAKVHATQIREEMRIMSDPAMREITENLFKAHSTESSLVCPQCGETNSHGNRMGKVPYCFKCNLPFITKKKAEKWIKPQSKRGTFLGYKYPEERMIYKGDPHAPKSK